MNFVGFRKTSAAAVVLTILVIFSRCLDVDAVAAVGSTKAVDIVQSRNQSTDTKPQRYIRGEQKAAVISEQLPDMKMEVCSAARLQQTIKIRGCQPRTVVNRYCYGQCNSFFIPRPATATSGRKERRRSSIDSMSDLPAARVGRRGRALTWTAFRSCSYCRPKRVEWITVGLNCPRRRPSYRRRRVQIVKECACAALTLD